MCRSGREEVEDVVLAGVDAGLERRPGDRRERRHRGAQRLEAALVAQPGQVGELALFEHRLGQAVVHAVEAEDDDALEPAALGSARQPKRVRFSSRTGQVMNVSRADADRGEDGEERAGQGEAGARPDVGVCLARHQQDQGDAQQEQ